MMLNKSAQETQGWWWTQTGWIEGACHHGAQITSIERRREVTDTSDSAVVTGSTHIPFFIPAPVDLHVHGGGGHDVMSGEAAIRGMLQATGASGTGALLATSVTAPSAHITAFLQSVQAVMNDPDDNAALLLGAHLEGPFINPNKLGAQPPHAQAVDLDLLESWLKTGVVRVITFAPELEHADALLALCQRYNVRAQIGHTLCSWQSAVTALAAGCGVTHLYNAMSGAQARDGGAAIAALAHADYAEIITDGIHVDQVAFAAARRAIPNLYSVTDATAASGMPDGEYQLGEMTVVKSGDAVRLADGTLAGSCLTQLRSIDVLRDWGSSWHDIASLISVIPARWIDALRCGKIIEGSTANWLEIIDNRVVAIWLGGCRQPL